MSDIPISLLEISKRIENAMYKDERDKLLKQLQYLTKQLETSNEGNEIYSNQARAAKRILRTFTMDRHRYCLLRANEQVGKTGTYHYLIHLMFKRKMIDNAYIICGSHEIELLNQCFKDRDDLHNGQSYKEKIHIIFRQHFNSKIISTKRSLIIIDESHLVQGKDQTLSKFLAKHELSLSGTDNLMKENDIYVVSVDATPYAEESAIEWGRSKDKFKVVLEDGDNYYGVEHYYKDGLIRPTFYLSNERGKFNFMKLLSKFTNKYILIRITSKNKQKKWLLEYAKLSGCNILNFTSHYDKQNTQITVTKKDAEEYRKKYGINIPSLEDKPSKTTIVILDGRLRCGKRVPKKHIGFIWEGTTKGMTDVIRQGLLGRMCGYLGDDNLYNVPLNIENRPLIFVPERILKKPEINKVIQESDLERSFHKDTIGPRYANNIIPGYVKNKAVKNGIEFTPCVPIRFKLNSAQTHSLSYSTDDEIKAYCLCELKDNLEKFIINNRNLTDAQKSEIVDKVESESFTSDDCHIRHYRDTSNQNMYKRHVEAYFNDTASKEDISDKWFLTFGVVYPNFVAPEDVKKYVIPGHVYAIIYTKASGYTRTIDKESRISKVNNDTQFTIHASEETSAIIAGNVYGFSPKILTDSDEFYIQLSHFIRVSSQGIGIFGKKMESLQNGEYITLPRDIYGDKLQVFQDIIHTVQDETGVKINWEFRKTKNIKNIGIITDPQIKYISWD